MGSTHLPRSRRAPDYYRLLGVAENALFRDIEQAYWRQTKLHRDLLPQLNAAYEVLVDPKRRAEYDEQRVAAADDVVKLSSLAPQRRGSELSSKLRWNLH